MEKTNIQPFYKKKWFLVVMPIILIIFFITVVGGDSGSSQSSNTTSVNVDLEVIRERVMREIEAEREVTGIEYRLHVLEYQASDNLVNLTIDIQERPSGVSFVESDTRGWADIVIYSDPEIAETFDVRASLWTVVGPNEVIPWGHTRFWSDDKRYSFSAGAGLQMLNR